MASGKMQSSSKLRRRGISAVRSKHTKPEMIVRRLLHAEGYRYRLHRSDLPGSPDLVFPSLKKVIFVNGCFWHGHTCKNGDRLPKTNTEYWHPKIARNIERDTENLADINALGWDALTVWECEVRELFDDLKAKMDEFLAK